MVKTHYSLKVKNNSGPFLCAIINLLSRRYKYRLNSKRTHLDL